MSAEPSIAELIREGPYGKLLLLVRYGSASASSDRDYLAVYDVRPLTSSVTLGGLDLWAVALEEGKHFASLLDPFISEPILTGEVLHTVGDSAEQLNAALRSPRPQPEVLSYLISRGMEAFLQAYQLAQAPVSQLGDRTTRRTYWSNLLFSMSYWSYSRTYRVCPMNPVSLEDVISQLPQALRDLWERLIAHKRHFDTVDLGELSEWAIHLLGEKIVEQPVQARRR